MPLFRVEDWDDAYANGPSIPRGEEWPEKWVKPAADFRTEWADKLHEDVRYDEHERAVFDFFLPDEKPKGLVVFIHGGFWIRLDKSFWSHLAKGALSNGWAVAMPSYPLCPEARVRDIQAHCVKAVTKAAGLVAGPIRLTGHSAGGQIVTRMISEPSDLPSAVLERIEHVVSLSGVHDLRPLLNTELNQTIRLDAEEAGDQSPALLKPARDVPLTCWVGANERSEFVRQNALLANIWRGLGLATEAVEEPDRHHFDVVDGLNDPTSPLTRCLLER